ncbi:asparagine synthase (glutamine-hydrolyzing) [Legionella impletisoli]|uniref:asparagine synthase (glutamine-hydrolyzing) n=1 Tax=Legionella impletisoli TaxID=343510 RepID=A0A917JRG4_9GAMM|nr:asparagine synthase (glutamine-hydrolyzing) [Legionella impletisoli]GGI80145.1 asparagine synthetase B [Legionella impletisoli]
MCGIAGIFLSDLNEVPSDQTLKVMINIIKHRGPDAQQTLALSGTGLAHARLSIIDLSKESNQPMIDSENGNVIVFNGEIYNYLELRKELIDKGHKFKTNGDTEVILKAYDQWGVECQNKFNGMWAFALYDKEKKMLFASRDRMGIKPFVYGMTKSGDLVFASEAKSIVQEFPEFKRVNQDFLIDFVERDFFACYKKTFYQNVFNLLPGHYFFVKHGEVAQQQRYWKWTPCENLSHYSDNEASSMFKELLVDAIKLRFRSDVPVGSCLSGGLDSSTIVGLASQLYENRLHTFSCIYPSTPEFDESQYIQYSVEKFNTIPQYIEPRHDDFLELMHTSIYEQDGPTGGPSILSQRAVMQLASQNVKVLLDGQGADELLGGYHGYFRYSLLAHLRKVKNSRNLLSIFNYLSNAAEIKKRTGQKYGNLLSFMASMRKPARFYSPNIAETQLHYFKEFENDDLNTILLEHVFTNLTNLLHYEDRNSMTFSIESRLPFLDYRLIEFAFSLPHQYKIRGSTTKWLLHNVAKEVLPEQVLNRKDKMGFTTPAHKWFLQNENLNFFKGYFSKNNLIYSSISQSMRDYLFNSFNILLQNRTHTPATGGDINALWRFFTANMWQETIN